MTNTNLSQKLLAIQALAISVPKNGENTFFKDKYGKGSKYMKLDDIVETYNKPLTEQKLLVTHFIKDQSFITRITNTEDDTFIESIFDMLATDIQKKGSECTYAKRYNLSALLNICADEDDDGNKASTTTVTPAKAYITSLNIKNLIKEIQSGTIVVSSKEEALEKAKTKYIVGEDKKQELFDLYSKELL